MYKFDYKVIIIDENLLKKNFKEYVYSIIIKASSHSKALSAGKVALYTKEKQKSNWISDIKYLDNYIISYREDSAKIYVYGDFLVYEVSNEDDW